MKIVKIRKTLSDFGIQNRQDFVRVCELYPESPPCPLWLLWHRYKVWSHIEWRGAVEINIWGIMASSKRTLKVLVYVRTADQSASEFRYTGRKLENVLRTSGHLQPCGPSLSSLLSILPAAQHTQQMGNFRDSLGWIPPLSCLWRVCGDLQCPFWGLALEMPLSLTPQTRVLLRRPSRPTMVLLVRMVLLIREWVINVVFPINPRALNKKMEQWRIHIPTMNPSRYFHKWSNELGYRNGHQE